MGEIGAYKEMKPKLMDVLAIKADEFHLLGYDRVDPDEIWNCVTERIDKRKDEEEIRLHQLVNEILTLSMNDYLNRLRMESLKGPDWFGDDKGPVDLN